jgi:hypothetical protein
LRSISSKPLILIRIMRFNGSLNSAQDAHQAQNEASGCRLPDSLPPLESFHLEHIVARQHGGKTMNAERRIERRAEPVRRGLF